MEIQAYVDADDNNPFDKWFIGLNREASLKVSSALERIKLGNTSNMESVGDGVHEFRIDFGSGYRIYFGNDGKKLIILLGGGTKKRQSADIDRAKANWAEYKSRKSGKTT